MDILIIKITETMVNISRKPSIMGTAGALILSSDPKIVNGKNFIDDEVIMSAGLDVEQFKVNPEMNPEVKKKILTLIFFFLFPFFFLDFSIFFLWLYYNEQFCQT